MTQTSNRSLATVFAALVAAALWLPTLSMPAAQPAFAAASAQIELA